MPSTNYLSNIKKLFVYQNSKKHEKTTFFCKLI